MKKEEKTTKSSKKPKHKKKKETFEWKGSPLPGHGSVFRRFFPKM